MGRSAIAVLAGLVVGILMVGLIQWAGIQLFPPPANLDMGDPGAIATYLASQPVGALAMVLMAWFFGAVDATILTAWLAPGSPRRHAAAVAGLLFVLPLLSLASRPYPLWFMAATPVVFLTAAVLGGKVGSMLFDRRRIGVVR